MGCKKYFSTYATNALPNKNEISTNEIVNLFPPGVKQHLVVYQSFIGRHPKNVFFFLFLLLFFSHLMEKIVEVLNVEFIPCKQFGCTNSLVKILNIFCIT